MELQLLDASASWASRGLAGRHLGVSPQLMENVRQGEPLHLPRAFVALQKHIVEELSHVTVARDVAFALEKIWRGHRFWALSAQLEEEGPTPPPRREGEPFVPQLTERANARLREGFRAMYLNEDVSAKVHEKIAAEGLSSDSQPVSGQNPGPPLLSHLNNPRLHPTLKRILLRTGLAQVALPAITAMGGHRFPYEVASNVVEIFASGYEGMLRYTCGIAAVLGLPYPPDVDALDMVALQLEVNAVMEEQSLFHQEATKSGLKVFPPVD